MIRVCAWCDSEGRGDGAVLGESEPLDDKSTTHGVCTEHAVKNYADYANAYRLAAAGPRLIERYITWPALYEEHGGG